MAYVKYDSLGRAEIMDGDYDESGLWGEIDGDDDESGWGADSESGIMKAHPASPKGTGKSVKRYKPGQTRGGSMRDRLWKQVLAQIKGQKKVSERLLRTWSNSAAQNPKNPKDKGRLSAENFYRNRKAKLVRRGIKFVP